MPVQSSSKCPGYPFCKGYPLSSIYIYILISVLISCPAFNPQFRWKGRRFSDAPDCAMHPGCSGVFVWVFGPLATRDARPARRPIRKSQELSSMDWQVVLKTEMGSPDTFLQELEVPEGHDPISDSHRSRAAQQFAKLQAQAGQVARGCANGFGDALPPRGNKTRSRTRSLALSLSLSLSLVLSLQVSPRRWRIFHSFSVGDL